MGSLADKMLASGAALHGEVVHGESVLVLSGQDAGKTFKAIREIVSDLILEDGLGPDPRGKQMLRFRHGGPVPRLGKYDLLRTDDGKQWRAVRAGQDGYLTHDFELVESTAKDQQ
jgi:hypothetical protein